MQLKGFEIAKIANFNKKQLEEYEESLKVYRDLKGVIDTSREEGREEGREERTLEVAKELKKNGVAIDIIARSTGLTKEEIQNL